jgi:mannose-6-phosphate isomerase-like protein (cupin superfamily)
MTSMLSATPVGSTPVRDGVAEVGDGVAEAGELEAPPPADGGLAGTTLPGEGWPVAWSEPHATTSVPAATAANERTKRAGKPITVRMLPVIHVRGPRGSAGAVTLGAPEGGIGMLSWDLAVIDRARADEERLYREFLRVPDLSAGLYVLESGATDPQSPHTEDELYYVVAGRGSITVGDETREVTAGSLVFVEATVRHRFHDIAERLEVLVVFGPAEGTRA